MDFREWQQSKKSLRKVDEASLPPNDMFFGRVDELHQLRTFVDDSKKKIFCLYGVPMIGKSTLVNEFSKIIPGFKVTTIRFFNPEQPEITLEKALTGIEWADTINHLIVFENFEKALIWTGERLHEIRNSKIKDFLQNVPFLKNVKLILESRFQIKTDFLSKNILSELSKKQLGKIERRELFEALNSVYRIDDKVKYEEFEEVCEALNDHVWLIELAMQDDWNFEDIREAAQRPESITQKLWNKIEEIIKKLPPPQKILLCAFAITDPISEKDLKESLNSLEEFSKKDELDNALLSLRKKLLLVYNTGTQSYEVNPYLKEVFYTNFIAKKEMQKIEKLSFFKKIQKPEYDVIIQAQEKGDYGTFYRLIHDLRKKKNYERVHEILKYVFENDLEINRKGVLNEIGITYKEQRNYKKAIEYLEMARELKNIPSYNELAIIYKMQKEYGKAIAVLKEVLEFNERDIKALTALALIYNEQGDSKMAIGILENARNIEPNAIVLTVLATIYKSKGMLNKAKEVLNEALPINDKDVKTLTELAEVNMELGDIDIAEINVNKGLKIEPNDYLLNDMLKKIRKAKEGAGKRGINSFPYNEREKIDKIFNNTEHIRREQKKILNNVENYYQYLIQLPKNKPELEEINYATEKIIAKKSVEIVDEIMTFITKAFGAFDEEMDKKLLEIYNNLKETDDWETKVKLSIPLLNLVGVNVENEFDLKKYIKKLLNFS